jgi:hypothetical protein
MQKGIIIAVVGFLTALPGVYAETSSSTIASTTPSGIREQIHAQRQELIKETQDKRATMLQEIKDQREAFRADLAQRREALKAKLDIEWKNLKDKLSKIKDERKKQIVETIAVRLAEINDSRLDVLAKFVDRLDAILLKIKTRVDTATTNGKDTTKAKATIVTADNALKAARDAIKAQTSKTYPINVTTENTLRSVVSKARDALRADLEKVHEVVRAAHKSIISAAGALHEIQGVDDDNNAADNESGGIK